MRHIYRLSKHSEITTSVRSERVFSISGNVNSERRNRLRPDISEKLVVLHDNLLILKNKFTEFIFDLAIGFCELDFKFE